ncbi:IS110 family transposase, partial [Micromonospora sp. ALFpr18c]
EGKTKREIIRCLKRYLAREVFTALLNSPSIAAMTPAGTASNLGLDA